MSRKEAGIDPGEPLLVRRPELMRMLGIKNPKTFYGYLKKKTIPPPFKYLSRATPVWRRADIEKWCGVTHEERRNAAER